ncbi:Ig-like domain-containing protein [Paenibacillus sp. MSJ-34]|uniref:Ig-like domain-containing protein n=1 Tax=Paenibacillus sp. MSJ-34 TaxID=2841529 RepID=UPI001C1035BE|nr:Ig-like domain-containing protein [Paenibacillus sp. MSJ-34]MBU5444956.1 Ig-like domain-containing protein [Paenibacillus sp. MSJ-34]
MFRNPIVKSLNIATVFMMLFSWLPGGVMAAQEGEPASVRPRAVPTELYVSPTGNDANPGTIEQPFRTLEKARDTVRAINDEMTEDITVYLRGGTYTLEHPVEFDRRDSGQNGHRIVYSAYPGEKPVLSGGRTIGGWSLHDPAQNIYKADASGLLTRQLYVNGERAVRARSEGGLPGATNDAIGHTTTMTEIANWRNVQDIEFVYNQLWTQPRNLVDSVKVENGKAQITMQQPAWGYNRTKGATATQNPVWIENAYELLDEPGEWYLDRGEQALYYIPRSGENMDTAEVVAPVTEKLLILEGTPDEPIHDMEWKGITFAYAGWAQASLSRQEGGHGGYPDIQGNLLRLCEPGMNMYICPQVVNEGHVLVKHAEHIAFERNTFTKLGQAGLDIMAGSRNIDVTGNTFTDISGSGIQIGEVDWADGSYEYKGGPNETDKPYNTIHYNPDNESLIIKDIRVTNNYIGHIGVDYGSSVGVFAGFPQNLLIAHNEIGHVPYSGVSVGWGWGRQEPSVAQHNRIVGNYIHDVMERLVDGGAIYTLGIQPDSEIKGNYIKNTGQSYGGIYPDEWTQYYTVTDNVIQTMGEGRRWLHLHKGHNNIIRNNYADSKEIFEVGENNTIEEPTLVTDGNWPPEAVAIMEQAGIQPEYEDIIPPAADMELIGLDKVMSGPKLAFSARISQLKHVSDEDRIGFYIDGGKALANLSFTYGNEGLAARTDQYGVAYLGSPRAVGSMPELQTEEGMTITFDIPLSAAWFQGKIKVGAVKFNDDGSKTNIAEAFGNAIKIGELALRSSDDFENEKAGDIPEEWVYNKDLGQISVVETNGWDGLPTKALKTQKTKTTPSSLFITKTVAEASGFLQVSARIKADQRNAAGYLKLKDKDGKSIAELNMHLDGNIVLDHGGGRQEAVQPYETGKWYEISYVLDTTEMRYYLFVNGFLKKSGQPFREQTDHLGQIVLGTFSGTTGVFYYDDIRIYEEKSAAPEGIVYRDDFETYAPGETVPGWQSNPAGVKGTVAETADAEGKQTQAFKLAKTDNKNAVKIVKDVAAASGIVTFAAKVKASQTNANGAIGLQDSKGHPLFQIDFKSGGATNINLGYPLDLGAPYQADQWVELKVVIDTFTNQFDTYVNGVKKSSRVYFQYAAADVAQIFVTIDKAGMGTFYFDDLEISARPVHVAGVTLNPETMTLPEGKMAELTAIVEPANAPVREVSWQSSDPGVAAVDGNGVVIALQQGTAAISATTKEGSFTASSNVTVTERVAVEGIAVSEPQASVMIGATKQLEAVFTPVNANIRDVIWQSSDPNVAVVDGNGQVTGVNAGTATITVATAEGGISASSSMTVYERPIQAEWYVSPTGDDGHAGTSPDQPFRTLERARDEVRNMNGNMTGDIVVYLMGGTHTLERTFVLDERDSGSNGFHVVYTAYADSSPVVSGGKKIEGWTLHDPDKQIYEADAGALRTRQLYVNGERAVRARSESGLPDATNDNTGHTTTMTEIANWGNVQDIEFVYKQSWTQPRNLVESIRVEDGKAHIAMQQPGWEYNRHKGSTSAKNPVWIENAYELLDEPGEWYLDRTAGKMYYIPREGEDMARVRAVAADLEQLVVVEGTLDAPARNIQFKGITFSYAGSLLPSLSAEEGGYGGYPDIQSNLLRLCKEGMELAICPQVVNPGHVIVKKAESIVFERNTFTKLGQAGLDIMAGSSNIDVIGNKFSDISGSGIQIGEVDWADGSYKFDGGPNHSNKPYNTEHNNPDDERKIIKNIRISNNYITDTGVEYPSSAGIYAGFTQNLTISHNDVGNVPYTGISVGWGWGRQEPSVARENYILNNYVHDVMKTMNDGGGIYTLGSQPDSLMKGNFVENPGNSFGGFYLDEWTQGYTLTDNVMAANGQGRKTWLLLNKGGFHNVIRNNYTDSTFRNNVSTNYIHFVYDNNQVITDNQWPQEARAIMENAGIQPPYRDILERPDADKSALESAVREAESLLEQAVEGEAPGQYPPAAMAALRTAIGAAQAILNDANADQARVDDAVDALQDAVKAFKASIVRDPDVPYWMEGKLEALDLSDTGVTLAWSGAEDEEGITGYVLYQDGKEIAAVTDQVYEVGELSPNTAYTFKVEAGNGKGRWSADGPSLTIKTPAPGEHGDLLPPSWPEGSAMRATNIGRNDVTLHWTPAEDNTGVAEYRITWNGGRSASVTGTVYSTDISGLSAGTLYTFTVQAGDAAGNWSADGPGVSVRTASGGCTNCGGGSTQPPAHSDKGIDKPEQPAPPAVPTDVGADDLRRVREGKVILELDAGKTELTLPSNAGELLKGYPLEVKTGGAAITVPANLLQALIKQLGDERAATGTIVIRMEQAAAESLPKKPGAEGNAAWKAGSRAFEIELLFRDRDGNEIRLGELEQPVRIALSYDPAAIDEELIGVYMYNTALDRWEYMGGDVDAGQRRITVDLSRLGLLAMLEYDGAFQDVAEDHWAYRALKVLSAKGIVQGAGEGAFHPGGRTTRAEFTAMLVRALQLNAEGDLDASFQDVDASAWYAADVDAASRAGLIQGVASDRFAPNERISREQMAALLVRAYEHKRGKVAGDEEPLAGYGDQAQVSAWARQEVNRAIGLGLMLGKGEGIFDPGADVARAETAQAVYHLLKRLKP